MLLPAAVRHLAELRPGGLEELIERDRAGRQGAALRAARARGRQPRRQPADDDLASKWAAYMRDRVIPAMDDVREVADRLEGIVADDLWPLPKYSEMLFIK